MLAEPEEAYVAAIVEVAGRDASIARVLREICGLAGDVRAGALDLVGAQLRASGGRGAPPNPSGIVGGRTPSPQHPPALAHAPGDPGRGSGTVASQALRTPGARLDDVLRCLDALKRDEIARSIAERLGPPG